MYYVQSLMEGVPTFAPQTMSHEELVQLANDWNKGKFHSDMYFRVMDVSTEEEVELTTYVTTD